MKVSNVLNKDFINSARCLAEKGGCSVHVLEINSKEDPLENIIIRFQRHPTTIAICLIRSDEIFYFTLFITNVVAPEIGKLDPAESTTGISFKLLNPIQGVCANLHTPT